MKRLLLLLHAAVSIAVGSRSAVAACPAPPANTEAGKYALKLGAEGKLGALFGELKREPTVVTVISSASQDALLFESLLCQGREQGLVGPTQTDADCLRDRWSFMATNPNADQMAAWQREHKECGRPQSRASVAPPARKA